MRVGAREVEELEDAEGAFLRPRHRVDRAQAAGVDEYELSAADLTHWLGAEQVERARLRGDDPVVPEAPERERTKPSGSRNAISVPSAIAVTEYAPSSRAIVAGTASSSGRGSCAIAAAISSESEVEETEAPSATSSARKSSALTRFPLCASAIVRARPWWMSGWALSHAPEPVVE